MKINILNKEIIPNRFSLVINFFIVFLLLSFLLRITFFIWQYHDVSFKFFDFSRTLVTGLFFDIGTCFYLILPGFLYLFIIPNSFIGSKADKMVIYIFFTLQCFILIFTFLAELTFWEEFRSRFNFIAVDYLIYTYEVVKNIQQSYPLSALISIVIIVTALILFVFAKRKVFKNTFSGKVSLMQRSVAMTIILAGTLFFNFFINNADAEWSANRYNNEISKAGIYSFFAAFRNNQMQYDRFYTTINKREAFKIVRQKLKDEHSSFTNDGFSIERKETDTITHEHTPNVVFILMESMSADFMEHFGNNKNISPNLDKLISKSVFFDNLYATGTRTVRGMEAVTLCIPPTPGQSIVKRPNNHDLYTISNVFKAKGYNNSFFYGGDGYFDNMNSYFGGNGFTIYDRGRGSILNDDIKTERHTINDKEVTFENAWGICDEDIFNKMLAVADNHYKDNKPFFNFVMTTSNHRPYTYPDNKIDIPSGTGRDGAVKYADYALGQMLEKAKMKPWFKNTVFVIVADHCASSAGKDEIDVAHYHIPAFIYNLPDQEPLEITKQCSQIDLFPTLFSMLHWDYTSNFFGKDVRCKDFQDRAFIATYIKLGLLEKDKVVILSEQKEQTFNHWNSKNNSLTPIPEDKDFLEEAISWYETADYMFTNKLLKDKIQQHPLVTK